MSRVMGEGTHVPDQWKRVPPLPRELHELSPAYTFEITWEDWERMDLHNFPYKEMDDWLRSISPKHADNPIAIAIVFATLFSYLDVVGRRFVWAWYTEDQV